MPELPEVETIRTSLSRHIKNSVIERVDVFRPDVLIDCRSEHGELLLTGRTVRGLTRRGKYLLMHLDDDLVVIMHMRMTGKLLYFPLTSAVGSLEEVDLPAHTHLRFHLIHPDQSEGVMLFQDVRRFGRFVCVRKADLAGIKGGFSRLGPEPLTAAFSVDYLWNQMKRHGGLTAKALLLRQETVAGIGNIYADEILFAAGVHPARRVRQLRRYEVESIVSKAKQILKSSIEVGGTTFKDYVDADNQMGKFGDRLNVYRRSGQPCIRCGSLLLRINVAGRNTTFCPDCQPRSLPVKRK
ncbi:MAG: bifunctional DNA-formamidopyrimidine glycosylase/DNA-(apurinic or apyrimidinic site) lyase [Fastidiosipilaceae bacterium]|jgi:formamidopyrimidine-DNA glycosylase